MCDEKTKTKTVEIFVVWKINEKKNQIESNKNKCELYHFYSKCLHIFLVFSFNSTKKF